MPTQYNTFGRRQREECIGFLSVSALFLTLLVLATSPLHAQLPSDISRLYILPHLTVTAADGKAFYRAMTRGREVDRDNVHEGNTIKIPAFRYPRTYPILPMIFFDQGSSAIPGGYEQFSGRNRAADYNENRVLDVTFETDSEGRSKHREILNIIGFRMDRYHDITIALQGGYTGEAGEDAAVGYDRSVMVRHYLHDIWNIDTSRVRLLPPQQRAGSDENVMILQEARRVDILCDDRRLTEDVSFIQQSINYRPIALLITLDPKMPISEVAGIMITIVADGEIMSRTSIPVSSDSSIYHLSTLWALPRMPQKLDAPLIVQATLQNWSGELRESNPVSLPLTISGMNDDEEEEYQTIDTAYIDHADYQEEIYMYAGLSAYGSGDTLIAPWQRLRLDSIIRELATIMQEHPGLYTISISASIDIGEVPDISPAEVSGVLAMIQVDRFSIGTMLQDPSLEVPLYILPKLGLNESIRREDRQRMEEEIARTLFGSYYDRIRNAEEGYDKSENGLDITEEMNPGITRLQLGRCREIERELRQVLPVQMIDTIIIDTMEMATSWLYLIPTPEGRFLTRKVAIMLDSGEYEPEPTYDDDDYEYDDDQEEYRQSDKEGVESREESEDENTNDGSQAEETTISS